MSEATSIEKARERNRRYYRRHRERERARSIEKAKRLGPDDWRRNRQKQRDRITRSYVSQLVGIPTAEISDDLYQTKRELLLLKRELGITSKKSK